ARQGLPSIEPTAPAISALTLSGQQWRPGRIGSKARRRDALFEASGNIDRKQRRPAIAAGIAEEHQHPPVRRECRPFIVEARGENPFARTIGLDDADGELTAAL